jgi:hypothetical protein
MAGYSFLVTRSFSDQEPIQKTDHLDLFQAKN